MTIDPMYNEAPACQAVALALGKMGEPFTLHYFKDDILGLMWRAKIGETTQADVNNVVAAYKVFRLGAFGAGGDA